jgi:hypothetical protein
MKKYFKKTLTSEINYVKICFVTLSALIEVIPRPDGAGNNKNYFAEYIKKEIALCQHICLNKAI